MRDGSPTVQPDSFTFTYSFDAITMVILGGSGSVSGAIVGGVFVTVTVKLIEQFQPFLREQLGSLADLVQPSAPAPTPCAARPQRPPHGRLRGASSSASMILRPEGLFGERELFRRTQEARPEGPAEHPRRAGVKAGARRGREAPDRRAAREPRARRTVGAEEGAVVSEPSI